MTSIDAGAIQQYFVTSGAAAFDRDPWSFWITNDFINSNPADHIYGTLYPSITVNAGDLSVSQSFWGLVTGDFNRSYTPLTKDFNANLELVYTENILLGANMEFELPILATTPMEIGAVSMIMIFPAELVEVTWCCDE